MRLCWKHARGRSCNGDNARDIPRYRRHQAGNWTHQPPLTSLTPPTPPRINLQWLLWKALWKILYRFRDWKRFVDSSWIFNALGESIDESALAYSSRIVTEEELGYIGIFDEDSGLIRIVNILSHRGWTNVERLSRMQINARRVKKPIGRPVNAAFAIRDP